MGGGDKALKALGGKPIIVHVIDALRPQVQELVINANGDPARFAAFGLPVVADRTQDFAGPLAGVLAGMGWARTRGPLARWIVTAACDTPFFPGNLVARLRGAAEDAGARIALAGSGGRSHFVFALWSVALEEDLTRHLEAGGRKVQDWIERHSHVTVSFDPVEIGGAAVDPFFNINTPEELVQAEALLSKGASS
jgi:molybdopterin-guanine dinucleotide biosynthesis protein A